MTEPIEIWAPFAREVALLVGTERRPARRDGEGWWRADPLAAWSRERHQTHALEPHAESDTIGARWFERAEQGRAHQA